MSKRIYAYTTHALRHAIKDAAGRPMHPIRKANGTIISTSRNLAGIRRYAAKHAIKRLEIEGAKNKEGTLTILFENDTDYRTDFGSFEVLAGWVCEWKKVYGAPLWINGVECGKVDRRNETLCAHAGLKVPK